MAKKIYISPSSQPANTYAAGNTNEQAQCRRIALATVDALNRCGFEAKTNVTDGSTMYTRVRESNSWGADLHVPIHTNAFNGKLKGTRMFCSSTTGNGGKACKAILKSLSPVVPGDSDGVQTANFYEITATKAPCAYCEAAFHDNAEQAQWIIDHVVDIGEAICKGICDYYGVKYIAAGSAITPEEKPEEPSPAPTQKPVTAENIYRVFNASGKQVGAYKVESNAANAVMREVKAGGAARITYGAK